MMYVKDECWWLQTCEGISICSIDNCIFLQAHSFAVLPLKNSLYPIPLPTHNDKI